MIKDWEFSAQWCDSGSQIVRCGYVKAKTIAEAQTRATEVTHPSAKVSVKLSGWNRRGEHD